MTCAMALMRAMAVVCGVVALVLLLAVVIGGGFAAVAGPTARTDLFLTKGLVFAWATAWLSIALGWYPARADRAEAALRAIARGGEETR